MPQILWTILSKMIRSRERFCILHGCVVAVGLAATWSSCAEGRVVAVKRKNRRVPASIHRAAQPRHRPIRQTELRHAPPSSFGIVAHDAFALDHDLHDCTCTQCSSKIKSFPPFLPRMFYRIFISLARPLTQSRTQILGGSLRRMGTETPSHWRSLDGARRYGHTG